jgi:hypothetical protein
MKNVSFLVMLLPVVLLLVMEISTGRKVRANRKRAEAEEEERRQRRERAADQVL